MDGTSYYWIAGAVFVLSMIVQQKLKSTYRTWSAVRNSAGITGARTAQLILDANQMPRVQVGPAQGKLTDHYNPGTKEIRLVDYTPLESRSRFAMLRSAALTYVAGVASAAGYIIYLAFLGGRWFARKPPTGAPPFKPPPAV